MGTTKKLEATVKAIREQEAELAKAKEEAGAAYLPKLLAQAEIVRNVLRKRGIYPSYENRVNFPKELQWAFLPGGKARVTNISTAGFTMEISPSWPRKEPIEVTFPLWVPTASTWALAKWTRAKLQEHKEAQRELELKELKAELAKHQKASQEEEKKRQAAAAKLEARQAELEQAAQKAAQKLARRQDRGTKYPKAVTE